MRFVILQPKKKKENKRTTFVHLHISNVVSHTDNRSPKRCNDDRSQNELKLSSLYWVSHILVLYALPLVPVHRLRNESTILGQPDINFFFVYILYVYARCKFILTSELNTTPVRSVEIYLRIMCHSFVPHLKTNYSTRERESGRERDEKAKQNKKSYGQIKET